MPPIECDSAGASAHYLTTGWATRVFGRSDASAEKPQRVDATPRCQAGDPA